MHPYQTTTTEFTAVVEGITLECVMESDSEDSWLEKVAVNGVDIHALIDKGIRDQIIIDQLEQIIKDAKLEGTA